MLQRLVLIISVSLAAAVLVVAPGVWRPSRAPELTDPQMVATPVILGCIPLPAGAAGEEQPPSQGESCLERTHADFRTDRIAILEC
jgi:hypothetical protein